MDKFKDAILYMSSISKQDLTFEVAKSIIFLVDKELVGMRGYSLTGFEWFMSNNGVLQCEDVDILEEFRKVGLERRKTNFGVDLLFIKKSEQKEYMLSRVEREVIEQYTDSCSNLTFSQLRKLVEEEF